MSLHQFIGNDVAFRPHELAAIAAAFDEVLRKLGLNDRKDKVTELVARKLIDIAKRGERDPVKLCEEVLKTFKVSGDGGQPAWGTVKGKNDAHPSTDRNAFLAELSTADYELFRPHLTSFSLTAGERLQEFGRMIEQVVFPHGGLIAMTMPLLNGGGGGAILVGRDSMVGACAAAAAVPAMCDAQVFIPGRAARMSASSFRYVLDQSPTIRRLAGRYTAALMVQAHQTALCNASHPVEARIARSLLEVLDRSDGFDVPLTQNTLAQMLGVQRTTINLAAGRLEKAGIIKCRRGYMQIVRRDQLERHACECRGSLKSYVSRLFALPVAAVLTAPPGAHGRKVI